MKKLFLLIFILFSSVLFSQEMIQGKLLLEDFSSVKFSVFNKNSNETINTDSRGIFQMKMSENDTLVFFHNDIVFDELIVPKHVIESKSLRYFLTKEGTQLDELVIDRTPFFNFGGKKLSPAEKLEHQNSIKPVFNDGVGISTDGIVNRISGRHKIIKRVKNLETSERNFKEFKFIYSDQILINQFKVPNQYVNMFVYFIVDDENFNLSQVDLSESYQMFLAEKVKEFKEEYEL